MPSGRSMVSRLVHAASIIVLLAAVSTACSGAPKAPSSPEIGNASSPAVTANELLSAPVPAACEHKAGRLVGGVQPGIPQNHGLMQLAWIGSGAAARAGLTAFGDFTGKDETDAAAILECNAGGVSWPEIIAFYSPGPTLLSWSYLTEFNLPGLGSDEQSTEVQQIAYHDGGVAAEWSTQDNDDAAATSSLDYSAVLRLSDHKIVATDLTGITELQTAEAFVRDLRNSDDAAANALAIPGLGAVADNQFHYYPSTLLASPKCYGLNDFAIPAPIAALISQGSSTQVMPEPDRICALASSGPGASWVVLGMRHTGFRRWQIVWIRAV
jgi:hypothetical protein